MCYPFPIAPCVQGPTSRAIHPQIVIYCCNYLTRCQPPNNGGTAGLRSFRRLEFLMRVSGTPILAIYRGMFLACGVFLTVVDLCMVLTNHAHTTWMFNTAVAKFVAQKGTAAEAQHASSG